MTIVPYHPTRKFSHRPDRFRVLLDHPLLADCDFAGLGQYSGSAYYHDSSFNKNSGAVINFPSANWDSVAGRKGLTVTTGTYAQCGAIDFGKVYTFAAWSKRPTNVRGTLFGTSDVGGNNDVAMFYDGGNLLYHYAGAGNDYGRNAPNPAGTHHYLSRRNGTTIVEQFFDGKQLTHRICNLSANDDWAAVHFRIGTNSNDALNWEGTIADAIVWKRYVSDAEMAELCDPDNVMLSGAIEPLPTQTHFLPLEPFTPPVATRVVYHPTRKYSHRPDRFRVVPDHPLMKECVFAGLGNAAGSAHYHDSSVSNNSGTIVNFQSAKWDSFIGRTGLTTTAGTYVDTSKGVNYGKVYTASAWGRKSTTSGGAIIGSAPDDVSSMFYIGAFTPLRFHHGTNLDNFDFSRKDGINDNDGTHHYFSKRNGTTSVEQYFDGTFLDTRLCVLPSNNDWVASTGLRLGSNYLDSLNWGGTFADVLIWKRYLSDVEMSELGDPTNVMLSGAIEPLPTQTYFLPLGEAQPSLPYDIFESSIIGA